MPEQTKIAATCLKIIQIPGELSGLRLDQAIARLAMPISRSGGKKLILAGFVTSQGQVEKDPARKIYAGEVFYLRPPPLVPVLARPVPMALGILYEDDDLIVIDKPAGLPVHPAPGHWNDTLVNGLLAHCGADFAKIGAPQRPGIVHRLDMHTSGVLVVAKTAHAYQDLIQQFSAHQVFRQYIAFVWGRPILRARITSSPLGADWGRISAPLGRALHDRKKIAIRLRQGRDAHTNFQITRIFGRLHTPLASKLLCQLETGRTHQIRVHLAWIGHGVIGDALYGKNKGQALGKDCLSVVKNLGARHALHAHELRFRHPACGTIMSFHADLPDDLQNLETSLSKIVFSGQG